MPLASVQTSSGRHMMWMWCHLASNDDGSKDLNTKLKAVMELDSVLMVISLQKVQ